MVLMGVKNGGKKIFYYLLAIDLQLFADDDGTGEKQNQLTPARREEKRKKRSGF